MDPNSILFLIAMGTLLGVLLGFMVSGEAYCWFFNALAGGIGAAFGSQLIAHTQVDMGPMTNALVAALATSGMTAMLLRS